MTYSLGNLSDPQAFSDPVDLKHLDRSTAMKFLGRMILIRRVEEAVAGMVATGEAKCPCHLAIGQEGVAVGVAAHLTPEDRTFGAHRSHAIYLALGGEPERLFAEILGKETGSSHGMGGSMHLVEPAIGLLGTVPIVAATIPIAAGAALSSKMDKTRHVAACFFGDGATEEGVFHETLNLAAVMRLPMLFVCENNMFSSHMHISLRQPFDSVLRYAATSGVTGHLVDGNDVVGVWESAGSLIGRARDQLGPVMIEAVTYRWMGHVGHRDDQDVGVRRKDELAFWKLRDPVRRLAEAMTVAGMLAAGDLADIENHVATNVASALYAARSADYPPQSRLLDTVYPGTTGQRID